MPIESTELPADIPRYVAGKYRVESPLQEGGMGIVCKGTHLGLERPVAIKFLRAHLVHNREVVERFLREARAAASLRSKHVVAVLDIGRLDSGVPYMVMEYLEGCDLYGVLSVRQQLPTETAVDYVLQACEAVAEAHAERLIHRDIKPENLFLTREPDGTETIKVLDFGVSKRLGRGGRALTNPGKGIGSPNYMAPEQISAPETVDERADIWALGAVLYELLTGKPPFDGASPYEICASVVKDRPTDVSRLRPDLPRPLAAVVMRCLTKNRDSRFGDVAELAQAIAPFAECSRDSAERAARILSKPELTPSLMPMTRSSYPGTTLRGRVTTGLGSRWVVGSIAAVVLVAAVYVAAPFAVHAAEDANLLVAERSSASARALAQSLDEQRIRAASALPDALGARISTGTAQPELELLDLDEDAPPARIDKPKRRAQPRRSATAAKRAQAAHPTAVAKPVVDHELTRVDPEAKAAAKREPERAENAEEVIAPEPREESSVGAQAADPADTPPARDPNPY